MSTAWGKFQDVNERCPTKAWLTFETGVSGFKFVFEDEQGSYFKWWFDKETWDRLKEVVEAQFWASDQQELADSKKVIT